MLYLLPRLCFPHYLWLSLLARFNLNHLRGRRAYRLCNIIIMYVLTFIKYGLGYLTLWHILKYLSTKWDTWFSIFHWNTKYCSQVWERRRYLFGKLVWSLRRNSCNVFWARIAWLSPSFSQYTTNLNLVFLLLKQLP